MKKTFKRKIRLGIILAIFIIISIIIIANNRAIDNIYADEMGSFTVNASIEKDSKERIALDNVNFSIYKIGHEKNNEWVLDEEFKSTNAELNFLDATVQNNSAKILYKYIKDNDIFSVNTTTDNLGKATFNNLQKGAYVIAQTSEAIVDGKKYISSPFLFSIPMNTDGVTVWQITSEPKFENEEYNTEVITEIVTPTIPAHMGGETKPETMIDINTETKEEMTFATDTEIKEQETTVATEIITKQGENFSSETKPTSDTKTDETTAKKLPTNEIIHTGDDTNILLYIGIMAIALVCIIFVLIIGKKNKK